MAPKTALVESPRNIIAMLFVLAKLGMRKELVLMGEYFLISST